MLGVTLVLLLVCLMKILLPHWSSLSHPFGIIASAVPPSCHVHGQPCAQKLTFCEV